VDAHLLLDRSHQPLRFELHALADGGAPLAEFLDN
jgi:hypothetical protein